MKSIFVYSRTSSLPFEMPVTIKLSVFFFYFSGFYLTFVGAVEPVLNNAGIEHNITNNNVVETQYATCKISTEELVANARATVTKVLTGACNAKTIDARFENLEKNLSEELQEIKTLLRKLLEERNASSKIEDIKSDYREHKLPHNRNNISPRQGEINAFNYTIKTDSSNGSSSVFTYYWEVKKFNEKLSKWSRTRYERSPTFYVGQAGYAMYLKIVPKYFPDGTVFVSVGLTRGRYDSFVKWPFVNKIQLTILDQSSGVREDRPSRIWDPRALCTEYFWGRPNIIGEADNPECVGLSIPRNILCTGLSSVFPYPTTSKSRYIWNDSVLVKLLIYF